MINAISKSDKRYEYKSQKYDNKDHKELFKSVDRLRVVFPELVISIVTKAFKRLAFSCIIGTVTTKKSGFKYPEEYDKIEQVPDQPPPREFH